MTHDLSPVAAGTNVAPFPSEKGKRKSNVGDQFFAICADSIDGFTSKDQLIDLLVLLVLASGTGRDHSTTSWSAEGARKKLALKWKAADNAIIRLLDAGRLESLIPQGKTAHPKQQNYRLRVSEDVTRRIWLPKTLVEGTDRGETPPIQILRQIGAIGPTLALLRCHSALDMVGNGGVDIAQLRRIVPRTRLVTRQGACAIWEWGYDDELFVGGDFAGGQFAVDDLRAVEEAGLLRWVGHLRDGADEDSGGLSPYDDSADADPIERDLAGKVDDLTRHHFRFSGDGNVRWVAVPKHIRDPQLVLVARPRYLPHTRLVGEWRAMLSYMNLRHHPFWQADEASVQVVRHAV